MKSKNDNDQNSNSTKSSGVRVGNETKKTAKKLVDDANDLTSLGNKVTSEDLYKFALSLVTPKHLKELKLSKITGDDYDSMLMSKFKEKKLGKTSSDFRNFQRTDKWSKFLKEHKPENLLSELMEEK